MRQHDTVISSAHGWTQNIECFTTDTLTDCVQKDVCKLDVLATGTVKVSVFWVVIVNVIWQICTNVCL
jgi:hypothetical protein